MTENLADYITWREEHYSKRLLDARAYDDIHRGGRFSW